MAKGAWDVTDMKIKCLRCGEINSFFDHGFDQVIITDDKGVILYVNKAVTNLTGYELSEIIGQTPALWGGQMPKKFYQDLWHKIKDEKQVAVFEVLNKKKNGEKYKAILRISPILDIDGKPMMFLGMETVFPENGNVVRSES